MREIFFLRANYFMGHFKGHFEGTKTFLTRKLSRAQRVKKGKFDVEAYFFTISFSCPARIFPLQFENIETKLFYLALYWKLQNPEANPFHSLKII